MRKSLEQEAIHAQYHLLLWALRSKTRQGPVPALDGKQ